MTPSQRRRERSRNRARRRETTNPRRASRAVARGMRALTLGPSKPNRRRYVRPSLNEKRAQRCAPILPRIFEGEKWPTVEHLELRMSSTEKQADRAHRRTVKKHAEWSAMVARRFTRAVRWLAGSP